MLGYLLARAGVEVVVLEKHADFLRDFRGDTIHPSTLEVMHELGILEEFLKRPHSKVFQAAGQVGDELITIVDFSHLIQGTILLVANQDTDSVVSFSVDARTGRLEPTGQTTAVPRPSRGRRRLLPRPIFHARSAPCTTP